MRFVDGTDLDELLEAEGPLTPERALALLGQAASALDTAHARGLVHRDVKPANILVTPEMGRDEHVYLSDFGLSRESGERDEREGDEAVALRASTSLGTIDYASPEQIEGRPTDARSDVYALGCVLYQALTGVTPYEASSPVQVLFGHLTDTPPVASEKRPELDAAINDVFARALAKDPDERYAKASSLIDDARAALAAAPRLRDRLSSRRAVALALAAITAIAGLTAGLALTVGGGGDSPRIRSELDGMQRDPGTLSRIDPTTDSVSDTVTIGPEPTGLVVADGGVFVTHVGDSSFWRIDAETLSTAQGRANGTPSGVASNQGGTGLFVADDGVSTGYTSHAELTDPIANAHHPTAITVAGSNVWIAGRFGLAYVSVRGSQNNLDIELAPPEPVEIERRRGSETEHEYFSDLAASTDTVWLTGDANDPRVWRIDRATRSATTSVTLPSAPHSVAVTGEAVWVTGLLDDVVWRIDPASDEIVSTIEVGRGAAGIYADETGVWVANALDGTVSHIDAATNQVIATIPVEGRPVDVAAGDGAVWVASDVREVRELAPDAISVGVLADCRGALSALAFSQFAGAQLPLLARGARRTSDNLTDGVAERRLAGDPSSGSPAARTDRTGRT